MTDADADDDDDNDEDEDDDDVLSRLMLLLLMMMMVMMMMMLMPMLLMMMMMMLMLMLLLPPCTFWPAGPLLGVMNREFGLLNLMNTPEHCSAPFHSVSSKVAKSTKMAAAHIQTYVLRVTWSILYTYLITPPEPVPRHGESKCFELGEF